MDDLDQDLNDLDKLLAEPEPGQEELPKYKKAYLAHADDWADAGYWTHVQSSHLYAMKYDKDAERLYVQFKGKGTVEGFYAGAPIEVARGMFKAISKGKYLHAVVKSSYAWKRTR